MLRKANYATEDYAFLLFYIPSKVLETGEVIFDTKLVKIDTDVNAAEILFRKAINLLNGPCPEDTCDWCKSVND